MQKLQGHDLAQLSQELTLQIITMTTRYSKMLPANSENLIYDLHSNVNSNCITFIILLQHFLYIIYWYSLNYSAALHIFSFSSLAVAVTKWSIQCNPAALVQAAGVHVLHTQTGC